MWCVIKGEMWGAEKTYKGWKTKASGLQGALMCSRGPTGCMSEVWRLKGEDSWLQRALMCSMFLDVTWHTSEGWRVNIKALRMFLCSQEKNSSSSQSSVLKGRLSMLKGTNRNKEGESGLKSVPFPLGWNMPHFQKT